MAGPYYCANTKRANEKCFDPNCSVCNRVTASGGLQAFSANLDEGSHLELAQLESLYKLILTGVRI